MRRRGVLIRRLLQRKRLILLYKLQPLGVFACACLQNSRTIAGFALTDFQTGY
jgi:hypothetical protein